MDANHEELGPKLTAYLLGELEAAEREEIEALLETSAEARAERSDDLYRFYRDGELTVTIDRVFPLADAKAAHDAIEGRQSKGKMLLEVGGG